MSAGRLAVVVLVASGCAGRQIAPRAPGCVSPTETTDRVVLVAQRTVNVAPPCGDGGEAAFVGPIRLTATDDGLHVQFEVADPSFVPGSYRQGSGQRDVVVVFPSGTAPGRPAVELAVDATPRGFRVDDILPWETWGFHHAVGEFRFVMSFFDREPSGAEHETRISMHVAVRPAS